MCIEIRLHNNIKEKNKATGMKDLFLFFTPLGLTTLLITVTHSLFNAGLARLSNPEVLISAFSVAKSLHHMLQSPILMLRQTFTALVDHKQNYYRVRNFIMIVGIAAFFLYGLIAYSGISTIVFKDIMSIKGETLNAAVLILKILVPFPLLILLREFCQGVAIKFKSTPLVTVSTTMRLVFVFFFVLFITRIKITPDSAKGGIMFLGAAAVEAIILFLFIKLVIGNIPGSLDNSIGSCAGKASGVLKYKTIFLFYIPLMATSYISTFSMPVINMGLARMDNPEVAISSFSVAWHLAIIIFGPLLIFHQVPINFTGEKELLLIKKFAVILGIFFVIIMASVSFSPLGYNIIRNLIKTPENISIFAAQLLKIFTPFPLLMIIKEYYWGMLIRNRLTRYVGIGTATNVITLTITVFLVSLLELPNPALPGALSIVAGSLAEAGYLFFITRKVNLHNLSSNNQ